MVDLKLKLPEGFLDEETRCGFTVTKKMKEVWAVELDLLAELLRVCNKNNIKIFASGGTMLGAVRHQGFIPWDDDIDMMMFRDDYERLCEIAGSEFQYPYFFQTEYTDPGSLRGHAQLRNSLTTGILESELGKRKFNQGIFLDIFPLDVVTDNEEDFQKQGKNVEKYKKLTRKYAGMSTRFSEEKKGIKAVVKRMVHAFGASFFEKKEISAYKKYELACQMYNDLDTPRVSTLSFQFANRQHFKYKEDFIELVEMPFEFLTIPVGSKYEHALTCRYGNYREIIKGSSIHGGVIFDTDHPYTERI